MNLAKIEFYPCTLRFSVSAVIPADCLVMLDLERSPPMLIFERPDTATTGQIDERLPTSAEMLLIATWVETLPVREDG